MNSHSEKRPILFNSKITLPRLQPNRVVRSELAARIEENAWRKFILFCAPAGFGKTTIVREWAELSSRKVGYFLLDDGDNFPHTFLLYLLASIRALVPQFGARFDAWNSLPALPDAIEVAADLVSEMNSIEKETVLVLDDFQVIHQEYILSLMKHLISHLPENIHVMVVSREEPDFGLATMRARNELYEIRMNDLRFSRDEVAVFLTEKMGLTLDSGQIDLLLNRTEGWAAGVQLAALSIRESHSAENMLKELSGTNRFILDFLMEEVLQRIDPVRREFLLRCSLIEKLCQPLCQRICADMPVIPELSDLEAANLFITNLDQDRQWYKLHPLFAESLRFQLQKEQPPEFVRSIYHAAADWEKDVEQYPESVWHYFLSGDLQMAGEIASVQAAILLSRGESAHCIEWLDQLPVSVTDANFGVQLIYGYGLISVGHYERIPLYLSKAQRLFDQFSSYLGDAARKELQARIDAIRAILSSRTGEMEETIRLADRALPYLPAGDAVRVSVNLSRAIAYHNIGKIRTAASLLEEVCQEVGTDELNQIHLIGLCNLGETWIEMGEFEKGYIILREAEEFCKCHIAELEPFMAMAYHGLGIYWYEQDDLDRAQSLIEQAIALVPRWGNLDIHHGAQIMLAQIHLARGQFAEADVLLTSVASKLPEHGASQVIHDLVNQIRLRLAIRVGEPDSVKKILHENWTNLDRATPFLAESLWLDRGYAELWTNNELSAESRSQLNKIILGNTDERVDEILLARLLLMVDRANGLDQTDMIEFGRILGQFKKIGYRRLLIDRGEVVTRFFQRYIDQLDAESRSYWIDLFGEEDTGGKRMVQPSRPTGVEPLSDREVEVLRCLQAGLSNTEIAARMVIATGTVKRHLHNIFEKLGVESRLAAIAQARKEGYL